MPTSRDQFQSREELGIAIDQSIAQSRMIPLRVRGGEAYFPAARMLIVPPLRYQFRDCKECMIAGMVRVEMGTDQSIDIAWLQPEQGQLFHDIFAIFRLWQSRRGNKVLGQTTINQDIFAVAGLHQVADDVHASFRPGRRCNLDKIEPLWRCALACHTCISFLKCHERWIVLISPSLRRAAE